MGPVKEIFYRAEHPQAKSFKAQAFEVSMYFNASLSIAVRLPPAYIYIYEVQSHPLPTA